MKYVYLLMIIAAFYFNNIALKNSKIINLFNGREVASFSIFSIVSLIAGIIAIRYGNVPVLLILSILENTMYNILKKNNNEKGFMKIVNPIYYTWAVVAVVYIIV